MEKKTKVFVARDKNGELFFYTDRPVMRNDGTFVGGGVVSDRGFMPFVKSGMACECTVITNIEEKNNG